MNTVNSTGAVWIDTSTHRVTLCEMDADVSYHHEDLRQGRAATNRVPRFSMLAGTPDAPSDHEARRWFWISYVAAVALTGLCAVVLALWPN